MTLRLFAICCFCTALLGCGADEPAPPQAASEGNADEPQTQAAAPSEPQEEAPMSEFLAESRHPIEPAPPGRFRLAVAGESLEGELSSCGWSMRTDQGQNQDRFAAAADWISDDGRRFSLEM